MKFTNNTRRPAFAKDPAAVWFGGRYLLYHTTVGGVTGDPVETGTGIGIAESADLEQWRVIGNVPPTQPCERRGICAPGAVVLEGNVHLFYQTYGNGARDAICHAVSADGVHFTKDPTNPVYAPPATWCCGRAIDADVCVFGGRLLLYYATRDHEMRVQMVGGAAAALSSGFGRGSWQALSDGPLLKPELDWEQTCIEAPAALVEDGKVYLFYGGAYNCSPQQIGCAVSEDGVAFRRLGTRPFLPCGAPGTWNSSESGHPFAFRDRDGRCYLFYQGSADGGRTWYLSQKELVFRGGMPQLTTKGGSNDGSSADLAQD